MDSRHVVTPEAEDVYFAYLSRIEGGEPVPFDRFCSEHPDLRPQLEELHGAWRWLQSDSSGPTNKRSTLLLGRVLDVLGIDDQKFDRQAVAADASRYRDLGEVARGGMGAIHKVWDATFRRVLAQKICIVRPVQDAGAQTAAALHRVLARFFDEAQITAQLDHPGIVPVHDFGLNEDGQPFFTMRFVAGRDLRAIFELVRTNEEGWTLGRAIGVLVRVAETVAFAHDKGVVHRDLKPSNVMVGSFGEVFVMDWGLAKTDSNRDDEFGVVTDRTELAHDDPDSELLTRVGAVLGTPAFMSPEQAHGRAGSVGPAADVYAIGAMLYELLAGFAPYTDVCSNRAESILEAARTGPPTALALAAPMASPELSAICESAMARSIDERYQSASLLATELQCFLDHRVVQAHRTGPVIEIVKWVRRHRAVAVASMIASAVLCIAIVTIAVLQSSAFARERHEVYLGCVQMAANALEAHEVSAARRYLEQAPEELRGWEWRHIMVRLDHSVLTIGARTEWTNGLASAENGSVLVAASLDGSVRILDTASGELVRELPGDGRPVAACAVHAASQLLAAVRHDEVVVSNLATGARVGSITGPEYCNYPPRALAFHPSQPWLATGHPSGEILISDYDDGRPLRVVRPTGGGVICLSFSPDGRWLASGDFDCKVTLWDLANEAPPVVLGEFDYKITDLAFTSDSAHLVTASSTVQVWRVGDRKLLARRSVAGRRECSSLSVHPDGARIASSWDDGAIRIWNWRTGADDSIDSFDVTLHGHEHEIRRVVWCDDGERLASVASASIKVWDPERIRAVRYLEHSQRWTHSVGFTPEGDRVWSVDRARPSHLKVWDAASGVLETTLELGCVPCAATFPGSSLLAISVDGSGVRCVDLRTGLAQPMLTEEHGSRALVYSRSGHCLVVGVVADSRRPIVAIDAGSGEVLFELVGRDAEMSAAVFGPRDSWFATGSVDGTVQIHEPTKGLVVHTLAGHVSSVTALAAHPTAPILASASSDDTIRLWSTVDGSEIAVLEGHTADVRSLAFHPDGMRLASGGDDDTIRLWDLSRARQVLVLHGHKWSVLGLAFSPDGRRLVSGCYDGSVGVWDSERSGPGEDK